jgi:hypothetical protein
VKRRSYYYQDEIEKGEFSRVCGMQAEREYLNNFVGRREEKKLLGRS